MNTTHPLVLLWCSFAVPFGIVAVPFAITFLLALLHCIDDAQGMHRIITTTFPVLTPLIFDLGFIFILEHLLPATRCEHLCKYNRFLLTTLSIHIHLREYSQQRIVQS